MKKKWKLNFKRYTKTYITMNLNENMFVSIGRHVFVHWIKWKIIEELENRHCVYIHKNSFGYVVAWFMNQSFYQRQLHILRWYQLIFDTKVAKVWENVRKIYWKCEVFGLIKGHAEIDVNQLAIKWSILCVLPLLPFLTHYSN